MAEADGDAKRLLPVVATHNIVHYTKILYSKTILGKKIEVKFELKCQLLISVGPVKHEVYCVGKLIYKIFSVTKTKNLFSFKKQVGLNWSWNKNLGGAWNLNFGVGLPPPVAFISLNFHVQVSYYINISLTGQIEQWTYPFRYKAQAVVVTGLNTDSWASLRVLAVEGGVFIKGTLIRLKTDPFARLYYYWAPQHKVIIALFSWYFEILAFQF